jgi:hypothetical protein
MNICIKNEKAKYRVTHNFKLEFKDFKPSTNWSQPATWTRIGKYRVPEKHMLLFPSQDVRNPPYITGVFKDKNNKTIQNGYLKVNLQSRCWWTPPIATPFYLPVSQFNGRMDRTDIRIRPFALKSRNLIDVFLYAPVEISIENSSFNICNLIMYKKEGINHGKRYEAT